MKVKELMDSLKGDCYRFRVHYPEEWEFGLITGATFFGKRGLVIFVPFYGNHMHDHIDVFGASAILYFQDTVSFAKNLLQIVFV